MSNQNKKTMSSNAGSTLDYIGLENESTQQTVEALQQLLADYQIFYTNLRGFHWHVKGKQFFTLHVQLEKMYNDAAEVIDIIAERILSLGATPENKFSTYLKKATLEEISGVTSGEEIVSHTLDAFKVFIEQERNIIELAEDGKDEGTADIITDFLKYQEKMTWMMCAYLEK